MAYNLNTLIPEFRIRIGDIDPATYRYTDAWVLVSLKSSVKLLSKWWNFKYLLDSIGEVYRNPNGYFVFDEATSGVLEPGDDQVIIIMAAIILLEGSLENAAWDFASWRDAEIAYSNLESSRARGNILTRLWNELTSILKVPQKRLARALKGSLPGYLNNQYERSDKY